MTVVECWFANTHYKDDDFKTMSLHEPIQSILIDHICVNRLAYLIYNNSDGKPLPRPAIIGNKTEGALLLMVRSWGVDFEQVKSSLFHDSKNKIFAFNSSK